MIDETKDGERRIDDSSDRQMVDHTANGDETASFDTVKVSIVELTLAEGHLETQQTENGEPIDSHVNEMVPGAERTRVEDHSEIQLIYDSNSEPDNLPPSTSSRLEQRQEGSEVSTDADAHVMANMSCREEILLEELGKITTAIRALELQIANRDNMFATTDQIDGIKGFLDNSVNGLKGSLHRELDSIRNHLSDCATKTDVTLSQNAVTESHKCGVSDLVSSIQSQSVDLKKVPANLKAMLKGELGNFQSTLNEIKEQQKTSFDSTKATLNEVKDEQGAAFESADTALIEIKDQQEIAADNAFKWRIGIALGVLLLALPFPLKWVFFGFGGKNHSSDFSELNNRFASLSTKIDALPKPVFPTTATPENVSDVKDEIGKLKDKIDKLPQKGSDLKATIDPMELKSINGQITKLATTIKDFENKLPEKTTGPAPAKPDASVEEAIKNYQVELKSLRDVVANISNDVVAKMKPKETPIDFKQKFKELDDSIKNGLKQLETKIPPAVPAPVEKPLDVAVVYCLTKSCDFQRLWPAFQSSLRDSPEKMPWGLFLGRGGNLEAIREIRPAIDGVADAETKLKNAQPATGDEDPGELIQKLNEKMKGARRAVVVVVGPRASVPDAATWGDSVPHIIIAVLPETPLNGETLARWSKFADAKNGSVSLVTLSALSPKGYEDFNEKVARRIAAAVAVARR